jgi:hypothetical protein
MTDVKPRWALALVWTAFVCLTVSVGWRQPGWDLRGEYVAARLIAAGHAAALYDQASTDAAKQQTSAWSSAALAGGIADRVVVSYIKTPLWAWLMSPLAAVLPFDAFKRVFAALSSIATAAMVFIAARQWAPRLAAPLWQAGLLGALFLSVPFFAALILGQTHVLFIFLVICACVASLNGRPVSAGALLAAAATVKITPVWVAVTWLAAGRIRAAASFAVCFCLLLALTVAAHGFAIFATFLQTLQRFGGTVLLAGNNCSFASVLLHGALNADTAYRWQTVHNPVWVGLLSTVALGFFAVLGGVLDRGAARPEQRIGGLLTLVAATAFSPLAWNHYYIVLVFPVMLMLDAARGVWRPFWGVSVFAVYALCLPPLAYTYGAPLSIVALRSQFWAALLCLLAMPVLALRDSEAWSFLKKRTEKLRSYVERCWKHAPPSASEPS